MARGGPGGAVLQILIGHWLTYSMVLIPAAWLALVWLKERSALAAAHG